MSRPKIYLSGGKIKVEKPEDIDRLKSGHAKLEAAVWQLLNTFALCNSEFNRKLLPGLFARIDDLKAIKAADEIEKE